MADRQSFDTSTPSANRSAQQGNGVGDREIQVMRDPGEVIDDIDDLDLAAETDEEPGLQTGRTNTRRPERTDASRGQGPKTLRANKDQVSRRN